MESSRTPVGEKVGRFEVVVAKAGATAPVIASAPGILIAGAGGAGLECTGNSNTAATAGGEIGLGTPGDREGVMSSEAGDCAKEVVLDSTAGLVGVAEGACPPSNVAIAVLAVKPLVGLTSTGAPLVGMRGAVADTELPEGCKSCRGPLAEACESSFNEGGS